MDYLTQLRAEAQLRDKHKQFSDRKKELLVEASVTADLHGDQFLDELTNFIQMFQTCNRKPKMFVV